MTKSDYHECIPLGGRQIFSTLEKALQYVREKILVWSLDDIITDEKYPNTWLIGGIIYQIEECNLL